MKLSSTLKPIFLDFTKARLTKLETLKLEDVLKRKNPYLFKAKNITTAGDFVKNILDAFLSSSEEGLFGGFLEELAIFVCNQVFGGRKSSAEGIDLEFERDQTKYIVSIKSGPNWGNSSQVRKMRDNFSKAKRILGTNIYSQINIVAVNGCCYGRDNRPDKGDYFKIVQASSFGRLFREMSPYILRLLSRLGIKQKKRTTNFSMSTVRSSTNLLWRLCETFVIQKDKFCGENCSI